jgi:methyl-accepting chemotaxis protein
MMRVLTKISVSALLGTIIGLVGLMLFGLTAQRAIDDLSNEAIASRIVSLSLNDRQLLTTIFAGRIERGDNLYALLGEAPIKPARQLLIADRRRQSLADFDISLKLLLKLVIPGLDETVANYKQTYHDLAALRPLVDKAILVPRSERDPNLAKRWRETAENYLAVAVALSEKIDGAIALHDPLMDLLLSAKRNAGATQAHSSVLLSVISSSVAAAKPWAQAEALKAAEFSGRVASDWDAVTTIAASPSAPARFRAAVAAAQATIFVEEKPLRQQLIDKLTAGEAPGIAIDAWLPHTIKVPTALGDVGAAALDDLVLVARAQAHLASRNLFISLGLLVAAGLLISVGLVTLRRRVSRPLWALTDVMRRLAERDFAVEVPGTARGDELGAMANAVSVFRENGRNMLRLEAEAAEAGRLANAERERAAAEQAERAAQQAAAVKALGHSLERLAGGDLTCLITASFAPEYDRLRLDFNAAVEGLHDALGKIIVHMATIGNGTQEIALASDDLSQRTERQAAGLEQTAAALQEITATVRRTADDSQRARTAAGAMREDAERSGGVVRDAVAAMAAIEESARQISQIIGVIDEIAFQTNLLALNAGVEAARAGESGRGFAVVATEVRALAQRSAAAAKEIKALIRTSEQQVGRGVALVGETGQALGRILSQVGMISGVIGNIAASAEQQATGLHEVNIAVAEMDHVTQQNAAMVEQTTAATHSLSQETEALSQAITRFRVATPAEKPLRQRGLQAA